MSEPNTITAETWDEQVAWAEKQADRTIAATGVPEGWRWGSVDGGKVWSGPAAERDGIIASLYPQLCGTSGTGQVYLQLMNADERTDHFAIADRVWEYWESGGWAVRDIVPPTDTERYFRADREDGAGFIFMARENWLALGVQTSCSAHTSVTDWELYRGQSNPFQEELDRREAENGGAGS